MYLEELIIRQWHYTRLAFKLGHVAGGTTSTLILMGLTMFILLKGRSLWRDSAVKLRIDGAGSNSIAIATRTEIEVLREIFLEHEYRLPSSKRPMTIVDLGAHIGLASRYLLARFPNSRVIAVEADPGLIDRLKFNLRGTGSQVINAAVGASSSPRKLYRSPDTWSNSLRKVRPWQTPVVVPGITFEDVLKRSGIDHVDLLKIDIEGAECEAFFGGVPDCVDTVIGEVHEVDGCESAECLDRLVGDRDVTVRRSGGGRMTFVATSSTKR